MEWKECCKWKEHDIFARNIRVTITTRHYQFILVIFKHRVKIFLSVRIFFKVWDSTSFLEIKSFIIRRFQIKSKWSTMGWYYWCVLVWNTNIEKRDIFWWKLLDMVLQNFHWVSRMSNDIKKCASLSTKSTKQNISFHSTWVRYNKSYK